ncbi:MAG: hypothetical protein M1812_007069 [Candelaria pacifica]|nr:MAG: hypothetical protein M1812_007069 [Candelaria pacifica]
MPTLQNIQVNIKLTSTGKVLEEYDSTKKPLLSTEFHGRKYIEAQTDEEFSVEIALKPGFKYGKGANGFVVSVKIDDGKFVDHWEFFRRAKVDLTRTDDLKHTFQTVYDRRAGLFEKFNFAFGRVHMGKDILSIGLFELAYRCADEDLQVDQSTTDKQAETMGIIHVEVYQVRRIRCPPIDMYSNQSRTERLSEGSTDLVKQRFVDHTMKRAQIVSCADEPPRRIRNSTLQEYPNTPVLFTFRYCSRLALSVLGCNVRDHPPGDDEETPQSPSKTDGPRAFPRPDLPTEIQDEMARLWAEVSRLQRAVDSEKEQNIEIKKEKRVKQEIKSETMNRSSQALMDIPEYHSGLNNKRRKVYDLTGDD